MSTGAAVGLRFTQATTQLVAAPTKDAGGNPVGGIINVSGLVLRNKSGTNTLQVNFYNGTSNAAMLVASSPVLAVGAGWDIDYSHFRNCAQGLFLEFIGTSPSSDGTVWGE